MTKKAEKIEYDQFEKAQLVTAIKYTKYRDFLAGNLKDGEEYTLAQVDALIKKHYQKG